MDFPPLVNGNSYDYVGITNSLLGNAAIPGVISIKYNKKQEKKDNYASGKYPTSRGRGKVEYEAEIELEEIEVRRILRSAGGGLSLVDIPPFTWVVSYLPEGATTPVTDVISFCEFTDEGIETKTGDTMISRKLKMICAGIVYGVQP